LEQPTKCIICENSAVQNPDFYLRTYDATCSQVADYVGENIGEFGTYESCEGVKVSFKDAGCICVGEDSTANGNPTNLTAASSLEQFTKCIICENSAVQNPDFYLRAHDGTCSQIADYIQENIVEFGTYESCEGAKIWFKDEGCICVGED